MNSLEELTEDRIDRAYVERRVTDWKRRIADLYANVAAWLPQGWMAHEGGSVTMHEELMRRFDAPAQELPVLRLAQYGTPRGRLEPRALWIIGNNGRLDLILPDRHYLIIDRSENFEPANWQVASLMERRKQRYFDRNALRDMLA